MDAKSTARRLADWQTGFRQKPRLRPVKRTSEAARRQAAADEVFADHTWDKAPDLESIKNLLHVTGRNQTIQRESARKARPLSREGTCVHVRQWAGVVRPQPSAAVWCHFPDPMGQNQKL